MVAVRLSLLAALFTVSAVSGHCFHGRPTASANNRYVCHVEAGEPPLEVGEVHMTGDCFNCSCSAGSYQCCGVGPNAGVVFVPEGYEVLNDWEACSMELVPIVEEK